MKRFLPVVVPVHLDVVWIYYHPLAHVATKCPSISTISLESPFHPDRMAVDALSSRPSVSVYYAHSSRSSFTQMLATIPIPPYRLVTCQRLKAGHPNPKEGLHPTLEPMIIEVERNPSAPIPDFHIDIGYVDDLRQTLRDTLLIFRPG